MNNKAREKLCELVKRYGTISYEEPKRLEAMLRDLCGECRVEINLLVNAVLEKIPESLLGSQAATPINVVISRLTKLLMDHRGVTEEGARWAVESWGVALGILDQKIIKTLAIKNLSSKFNKPVHIKKYINSKSLLMFFTLISLTLLYSYYKYQPLPKFEKDTVAQPPKSVFPQPETTTEKPPISLPPKSTTTVEQPSKMASPQPTPTYGILPKDLPESRLPATTNDKEQAANAIKYYFNLIQNKNVDEAIKMYAEDKKPFIKKQSLLAIARDTEYYEIKNITYLNMIKDKASLRVFLLHKNYRKPLENWNIDIDLLKENGDWKIISTSGKEVRNDPVAPTKQTHNTNIPHGSDTNLNEYDQALNTIKYYFKLVQDKNIDKAIEMYSNDKKIFIKRHLLAETARDTEYYEINNNFPLNIGKDRAKIRVLLLHKKYNKPIERWQITIDLLKENGSWKISDTSGEKLS